MKRKQIIFSVILGLFFILLLYGTLIEPYRVDVHHLQIEDAGIHKILEGRIAVHISDLHIKKIGKREKIILKIIDELEPDFIFLTGDYVKWGCDYESSLNFLSTLKANIGVWAVMGDYDYNCSRKSCLFCHKKGSGTLTNRHKVKFLRNEMVRVNLSDGYVWLGGIDLEAEHHFRPDGKLGFLGDLTPAIILGHDPFAFDLIDEDREVLLLAGDTHGGQIPLPSWLWSVLGYEKNARYNQGLFQNGRKKMYVSRGIGTSHFPLRLLNPPEFLISLYPLGWLIGVFSVFLPINWHFSYF